MRRSTACLAVLFFAVTVAGCSLFDDYAVTNWTDGIILIKVEQQSCSPRLLRADEGWTVMDPGSSHIGKVRAGRDACLVVADMGRRRFEMARIDDGAQYIVQERENALLVQRSGGEYTATEVELVSPDDDDSDASPKLLWVIGLPALLSAVYLVYAGIHFLVPGDPRSG